MRSNLERFQVTKLCPFQEKIRRQYLSTNVRGKYSLVIWVHINNLNRTYQRMVALLPLILGHLKFFVNQETGRGRLGTQLSVSSLSLYDLLSNARSHQEL